MSRLPPDGPPVPRSAPQQPNEGPAAPRRRAAAYVWEHDTPDATEAAIKGLAALARAQGYTVSLRLVERRAGAGRFPYQCLRRLFMVAEGKRIEVAFIETIDALGVSPATVLRAARRLKAAGVSIVSASEPWFDPDNPTARWLERAERRRLRESAATLEEKRSRGERTGQLRYGDRVGDDGVTVEPDPHEQEIMERCRSLRAYGNGYRAIARSLNSDGFRSRAGTRLTHRQVARMLAERGQ